MRVLAGLGLVLAILALAGGILGTLVHLVYQLISLGLVIGVLMIVWRTFLRDPHDPF
jgi:type IV secretory pathway TrbL component